MCLLCVPGWYQRPQERRLKLAFALQPHMTLPYLKMSALSQQQQKVLPYASASIATRPKFQVNHDKPFRDIEAETSSDQRPSHASIHDTYLPISYHLSLYYNAISAAQCLEKFPLGVTQKSSNFHFATARKTQALVRTCAHNGGIQHVRKTHPFGMFHKTYETYHRTNTNTLNAHTSETDARLWDSLQEKPPDELTLQNIPDKG